MRAALYLRVSTDEQATESHSIDAQRRADCLGHIEAHHWHGYDKEHWLDVVWLCHRHRALVESGDFTLPYFALSGRFTKPL